MRTFRKKSCKHSGVSKGGSCEGGQISIIGVVRAPVAIINFAFCVRGLPFLTQRFSQGVDAKLIIATGARTTPIIEISHPLETPKTRCFFGVFRDFGWVIGPL